MLEWAAYLKHWQFFLLKYDAIGALAKSTMLKYFQKSQRPFILAKPQNKNIKLESFIQIMKKLVITKAKVNLWP